MTPPTALAARPSADRHIPVRRLRVPPDVVDSDWIVADDPIFSHLLATLSAVFPNGEDFFVASVRRHRDAVADNPVLKAQVKGFIGQEAMHGREHRALNRRLAEVGYNTVRADRAIQRICNLILKARPRLLAIAATAAAEHYTGLLAETALEHEPTRKILFGQESVEPLICWHSLEELEHKNVAFDVMVAAGAGYPIRAAGFLATSTALAGYVGVEWGRSVFEDRHRITRALALHELGQLAPREGPSALWTAQTRVPTRLIGLVRDREQLAARIDARVLAMVAAGAGEEAAAAQAAGASATARKALGFEQLLRGDVEAMQRDTRRYAKRQLTWMRKLAGVEVLDVTDLDAEAAAAQILAGPGA